MDTRRLILLVVFGFSVLMLWDAWLKQSHPIAPAAQPQAAAPGVNAVPTTAVPVPATAVPVPTPAAAGAAAGASAVPTATAAVPGPTTAEKVVVKTDLYAAEISTQGGDLVRLALNNYRATDEEDKRFVLLDDGEHHIYEAQSGLIGAGLPNHKTLYQLVPGPRELKDGQDSLELRLEASGADGVRAAKVFRFTRGSYLIDVSHEVVNGSAAAITPSAYFQLARDGKAAEQSSGGVFGGMGASTFTGPAVYTEQSKYQKVSFEDIAKGKAKFADKADNGWVAMIQHYFVAALLPADKAQREYFMRKIGDDMYASGIILPMAGIAPGATGKISVPLYAGPQEQDKLA
jgi:YidC/Oxa1 family membrane protein insertase